MKECICKWLTFNICSQPKPIDVQVITHHMQRYAVWFGGSMLASTVSVFLQMQTVNLSYLPVILTNHFKIREVKHNKKILTLPNSLLSYWDFPSCHKIMLCFYIKCLTMVVHVHVNLWLFLYAMDVFISSFIYKHSQSVFWSAFNMHFTTWKLGVFLPCFVQNT